MTNLTKFNQLNGAYQRVIEEESLIRTEALKRSKEYGEWARQNGNALMDKFKEIYSYQSKDELDHLLHRENEILSRYSLEQQRKAHFERAVARQNADLNNKKSSLITRVVNLLQKEKK